MTSGIWDVEAIRNCTHECEYAPPTPRLSTGPIYSDFPVARALQGRPHVRRSRAADEHRTTRQNDDRRPPGRSAYRHLGCARPVKTFSVEPDGRAPVVTRLPVDMERLRAGDEFIRGPYRSVVRLILRSSSRVPVVTPVCLLAFDQASHGLAI